MYPLVFFSVDISEFDSHINIKCEDKHNKNTHQLYM